MSDLQVRNIRSTIPTEWARRLAHLAADTGLSRQELMREGVLLVLRYHEMGESLPEPVAPVRHVAEARP